MNRTPSFTQPLGECRDTSLVGGKAANLGRLMRAGFPVPDGFVVTTRAYRLAQGQSSAEDRSTTSPRTGAEISDAFRSAKDCGFRGAKGNNATLIDSSILRAAKQIPVHSRQFY